MANELIKISLPDVTQEITLENEWFQKRDTMLAEAQGYTVATANNADAIGEAVSKLGKMASKIESERKKLTAPFLTAQKTIKAVVDKATEPIAAETMRLKELLAEFAESERRRLFEEARKAEMERLAREAAEADRQRQEEQQSHRGQPLRPLRSDPASDNLRSGEG